MCFYPGYSPLQRGRTERVNYLHHTNNIDQNFVKVSGQSVFSLVRAFCSALFWLDLAELVDSSWLDLTYLGVRGLVEHDSLDCCMHGLLWGRKYAASVFFIKPWPLGPWALEATKLFAESCGPWAPLASCVHLQAGCPRTTVSLQTWADFLVNARVLAQQTCSTFSCVGKQLAQVHALFSLCCGWSFPVGVKW